MRRVLITTTINVPVNLVDWRKCLDYDDVIIVAGDRKTPHYEVAELLRGMPGDNRYLGPADQRDSIIGQAVPWNCVQRRNVALAEAIRLRPRYVITVDDDNWPTLDDQVRRYDELLDPADEDLSRDVPIVSSESGWFDAGELLDPAVSHRGFPFWLRGRQTIEKWSRTERGRRVGVAASLWIGDPDVDAVTRLALGSDIVTRRMANAMNDGVALGVGTWCPFNSQATAYRAELAPLMMVWPGVGRYDDIWASFLARRVMDEAGSLAWYGEPMVEQRRNKHDVLTDLEAEWFGMRRSADVIQCLRDVDLTGIVDVEDALARCLDQLQLLPWLPTVTREAFTAWQLELDR